MKNTISALLLLCSLQLSAQCKDIYGSSVDCPSAEDSLTLYNNALKVMEFYENNKLYHLTNSVKLESNSSKSQVFEDLRQARRMFNIIRRELREMVPDKFSAGKPNPNYKDIPYSKYYNEIDDYRFYQRELENQIINSDAPMSMYDNRISPIMVNTYTCTDTASVYFNDLVNIPLYVPVVVKPFALLTEPELMLRSKILNIPLPMKVKRNVEKRDSVPPASLYVKKDTIQPPVTNFTYLVAQPQLPVYLYNNYGSACVIGFMIDRKFKKLTHDQYAEYAVTTFARSVLEDDIQLDKILRIKFGAYYSGIIP